MEKRTNQIKGFTLQLLLKIMKTTKSGLGLNKNTLFFGVAPLRVGLNDRHLGAVAGHLVTTHLELRVAQVLIDEVVVSC